MSVFILETDAVTSAADSLSSIESSLENLSSTVNSYDTSQSSGDSFDFDGAKSVIAENIKAASIKVQNTQTIMNSVVDSHTKLQQALTTNEDESSKSSKSSKSGSSGNYSSSGYYSSGGGYSTAGTASVAGTAAAMAAKKKVEEKEKEKTEIIDVKDKINKVSYVYPNTKKLSEESKTIFNDVKYDDDGYAKLNDYYVISADKSVGNVGDVIKFTKEDGTSETFVIGINTVSDKYKNTVSFIINEERASNFKPIELSENILKDNNKIENCGNYKIFEESKKIAATATTENNTNLPTTNNENLEETVKNETTNVDTSETTNETTNETANETIGSSESNISNTSASESEDK